MKINVTMEGTPEELNKVLDALLGEADEQSAEIDFERIDFTEDVWDKKNLEEFWEPF